jgi:hypothetical protein
MPKKKKAKKAGKARKASRTGYGKATKASGRVVRRAVGGSKKTKRGTTRAKRR